MKSQTLPHLTKIIALTLLFSFGCAKSKSQNPLIQESAPLDNQLKKSLTKIQTGPLADDCDQKLAAKKTEIIQALDIYRADIEAKQNQEAPSADKSFVDFEGGKIEEIAITPPPTDTAKKIQTFSWDELSNQFQKIKSAPYSFKKWAYALNYAKILISEDLNRTVYYTNLTLEPSDEPALSKIIAEVAPCAIQEECGELNLTAPSTQFANQNSVYHYVLGKIKGASSRQEAHEWISNLYGKLEADYATKFKLPSNGDTTAIVNSEGITEFRLTLDLSAFSNASQNLAVRWIESVWSSDHYKLKLVLGDKQETSSLFKYFFFPNDTQRDTTYHAGEFTHEVHLFTKSSSKAFAHETGHVLGLNDHYWEFWNRDLCAYQTTLDPTDVMSDHIHGVATPGDWEELIRRYPVSAPKGGP